MKIDELLGEIEQQLADWKASKELCKSSVPNEKLGASALSSCKSQGYRAREGNKVHTIGKKRVKVAGKKVKGERYGGPIKNYD